MHSNPHFVDSVSIQRARYLPFANEQAAYNRYRNGELHAIASFPANELARVAKNHAASLRQAPLLSMMYLVFNTDARPLMMCVCALLWLRSWIKTCSPIVCCALVLERLKLTPEMITAYQAPLMDHTHAQYPIERAKRLLAEAGYDAKRPLRITLRHVSGNEEKRVNLAVAGMWRQLGVQTQLQQGTMNAHFADLRQGDFDVAWAGWIGEVTPSITWACWPPMLATSTTAPITAPNSINSFNKHAPTQMFKPATTFCNRPRPSHYAKRRWYHCTVWPVDDWLIHALVAGMTTRGTYIRCAICTSLQISQTHEATTGSLFIAADHLCRRHCIGLSVRGV